MKKQIFSSADFTTLHRILDSAMPNWFSSGYSPDAYAYIQSFGEDDALSAGARSRAIKRFMATPGLVREADKKGTKLRFSHRCVLRGIPFKIDFADDGIAKISIRHVSPRNRAALQAVLMINRVAHEAVAKLMTHPAEAPADPEPQPEFKLERRAAATPAQMFAQLDQTLNALVKAIRDMPKFSDNVKVLSDAELRSVLLHGYEGGASFMLETFGFQAEYLEQQVVLNHQLVTELAEDVDTRLVAAERVN